MWRRSLWVLFRYPTLFAGVLVGSTALSLSVLSGGVLVDAAGTASLEAVIDAVPESAFEARQPGVRAFLAGPESGELDREVTELVEDLPGVGSAQVIWRPMLYRDFDLHPVPTVTNPATRAEEVAVLFTVTGGIDALVTPQGERATGEGLWIPDVVAESLRVGPGDEVVLELHFSRFPEGPPPELVSSPDGSPPAPTAARVAGVYSTVDGDALPQDPTGLWASLADEIPPWPRFVAESTPQVPLLVADADTYRTLTHAIGEESLATWEAQLEDPTGMTIAEADRLARTVDRLDDEGSDPNASLGRLIAAETGGAFRAASGIGDLAQEARMARAETADGVAAMRITAVGLSWSVVVLGTVAMSRRRRDELRMLVEVGRGPVEIGSLSMVESLFPVVVGIGAAVVATDPLVEWIVGTRGRLPDEAVVVVGVGVVVSLTIGLVSALNTWRIGRTSSGRAEDAPKRLPWRSLVVGAAAVTAIPVVATNNEAGFDAVTALFPLLALAAASILVVAVVTGGLGWSLSFWSPKRLTARLVASRSVRDAAVATALMATTVSFGVVAFGVVSAASVSQATSDKVAAQAGAVSAVRIPTSSLLKAHPEVMDGSTVVWLNPYVGLGDFVQAPLLAVDPATFGAAGLWSDRNARGLTLSEVLDRLQGSDEASLRMLVAGDTGRVPDGGILDRSTPDAVPYSVVDRLAAFPGTGKEETLLIVEASSLFDRLGDRSPISPEMIEEDDPDGPFTTEIWSSRPIDDLTTELSLAGIPFDQPRSIEEFSSQPVLVARGWALDYLRVFTLVAGALGVAILVGLFLRDRDRRQIQSAVLADFGYSKGTMAGVSILEVGIVALVGSTAGALLARWITRSVAARLDPLPNQAPFLEVAGTASALIAALGFVTVTLIAAAIAGSLRRSRSINELLRDE